jgi:hypothetical protein
MWGVFYCRRQRQQLLEHTHSTMPVRWECSLLLFALVCLLFLSQLGMGMSCRRIEMGLFASLLFDPVFVNLNQRFGLLCAAFVNLPFKV